MGRRKRKFLCDFYALFCLLWLLFHHFYFGWENVCIRKFSGWKSSWTFCHSSIQFIRFNCAQFTNAGCWMLERILKWWNWFVCFIFTAFALHQPSYISQRYSITSLYRHILTFSHWNQNRNRNRNRIILMIVIKRFLHFSCQSSELGNKASDNFWSLPHSECVCVYVFLFHSIISIHSFSKIFHHSHEWWRSGTVKYPVEM